LDNFATREGIIQKLQLVVLAVGDARARPGQPCISSHATYANLCGGAAHFASRRFISRECKCKVLSIDKQCRCLQSALTRGLDACPTYVAAAMKCNYWSHSFHCNWIPARPVFWAGVVPWAAGCYRGLALSNSDPSCPDSSTVSSLPSIDSILSQGKTLQGNCGTNISTFYSNFPIVK
jgi:hypothetical protein